MKEEEKKAMEEDEIKFRAYLLILNSEFPTHRKKEAMEELLKINNKQQKEIEELKVINNMQKYRIEVIDERELISKDKIRELIKELAEQMKAICKKEDCEDYQTEEFYKIQSLKELLEE